MCVVCGVCGMWGVHGVRGVRGMGGVRGVRGECGGTGVGLSRLGFSPKSARSTMSLQRFRRLFAVNGSRFNLKALNPEF